VARPFTGCRKEIEMKNSLQKDFEARKNFYTNRASAVFPIHFMFKENDLLLSWLNYWSIKNKLDSDLIVVNLRLYNNDGELVKLAQTSLQKSNNLVSIREYIKDDIFKGMVEIEIISSSNLKFSFPAITGFYKSGSLYSCVHSAGRIRGSDEVQTAVKTEETNWSCKFAEGITPFFHYVNGTSSEDVCLLVTLYRSNGESVDTREVRELFNPFASKIYYVDQLFNNVSFEEDMFVGVKCNNDKVFRRMVVGNYHKKNYHLEVAHSFPWQTNEDHCPINKDGPESFLAMYSDKHLKMKVRVFPTNCAGEYKVTSSEQKYNSDRLGVSSNVELLTDGHGIINLSDDTRFKLLGFKGAVPSRLNSNFIYTVNGAQSDFSTDIATGAKSSVYPPKVSHWGSGVFGNGYDFVLMIRNCNHICNALTAKGKLEIYGLGENIELDILINGQSSHSILLSDIVTKKFTSEAVFTWFLKLDQPDSETFWTSFRDTDGCIVGEHGF
tara:strand:+ start:270 stop:1757 length:1488 start_codon:yes stop_codon:yes gene_type:complete